MHMSTINRLGAPVRYVQPWTPYEKERVRKEYRTKGAQYLADQLRRTKKAIQEMAREMLFTPDE